MRILQLGKYYEPYVGGIETHLALLADGLASRGVEVEVLVHNRGRRTVRDTVRGVPITRVGALARMMSTELSPRLVMELSRSYDILHLHTPHPMGMLAYLAARKPRHTLVVTHHSDIVRQAGVGAILRPLFSEVMSRADAVIATSRAYLESSRELRPVKDKVQVIPYGIDLTRFSPALRQSEVARALRAQFGERLILAAGRLIYYKGFEVLLDALRCLRGHLLLVGDGPLRAKLVNKAQRLGVKDRVTFLGSIPNDQMGAFYGAASVFALPSTARSEAFGIVQIEALASGLPVVNTALASGVPYVSVNEQTGLTVEPNNPDQLARALNRILDDKNLASRLGAAARERALALFTSERMVEETWHLYRSLREPAARNVHPVIRTG